MNSGLGRKGDIELLLDLAANMDGTTICPLAAAAAWPVQSAIKKFPEEFEALLYSEEYVKSIHTFACVNCFL